MPKMSHVFYIFALGLVLTACGSDNSSAPPSTPKTPEPINAPPTIKTERTIVVAENTTTSLSADVTDRDGEVVSISWVQLNGPQLKIENGQSASVSLTTPEVEREGGVAELEIAVVDDDGATTRIVVQVEIHSVNKAPIAIAGDEQSVRAGNGTRVSGGDSYDPDGTQLAYRWVLVAPKDSRAELSTNDNVIADFVPDVAGLYIAELTVTDEDGASAIDQVEIYVQAENMPPIAEAGQDRDVATGSDVHLNGKQSYDPEGANISYFWRLEKPDTSTATLSAVNAAEPTFFADVDGQYRLYLVVNDGQHDSAEDAITIHASAQNAAPIADAGANQSGSRGIEVNLDGSASYDANNDPITYAWSITSQPANSDIALLNADAAQAAFIPHEFGSYVIMLTVSDGELTSSHSTVVTVAEGDIYIDLPEQQNVRFGWPFTGYFNMGDTATNDPVYDVESLALIATGADFKIKFSAIDRNNVTTPYCTDLYDGKIIRAGEPVYFSCGVNVVKGQAFDVEFRIEIEGYPNRVWVYVFEGKFI